MVDFSVIGSALLSWIKLNWILLLFLLLVASAFVFLRNKPSKIEDADELSGILTDGHPTVIEFYSNY